MITKIIVGGVIGWVASMLMATNAQMGIIANVLVGIVGSGIGASIGSKVGGDTNDGIMGWVFAVGGAAILIFILKVLGIFA